LATSFPLFVPLTLLDRFSRPLAGVGGALDGFAKKATKLGQKLSVGVTVPLTTFGTLSVRTGLEYQRAMNRVQAVTGATAAELAQLDRQAQDALGATGIPSTARASAAAMLELARSGMDVTEVQRTLPGVLALSRAAWVSEAEAAKGVADVLDVYALSATEAGRVTDLLAHGANRGQQEFAGLTEGLTAAGPAARAFRQDLEGTAAVLDVLADAGAEGSAGAALYKKALTALVRPSAAALAAFEKLKVRRDQVFQDDGQLRQLDEVLGVLSERGATAADAVAIFGAKAGPGLSALLGQGGARVRSFAEELRGADGAATRFAQTALGGGVGSLEEFERKWEQLLITVARSGLLEALGDLATMAGGLIAKFQTLSPTTQRWVVGIAGVAAALGPAILALGQLAGALGTVSKGFAALRGVQAASALAGAGGTAAAGAGGAAAAAGGGGLLATLGPLAVIGASAYSLSQDLPQLFDIVTGMSREAAQAKSDREFFSRNGRPALDAGARAPALGTARLDQAARGQGAGGGASVGGVVRVEFENAPPGTRVAARRTGDVPLDVDVGYNLAAGFSG
jgi:TP901 family phage tail tape measure protein